MAKKIKNVTAALNELNPHHKRLLEFVHSQTTNVSGWVTGLIEREFQRVNGTNKPEPDPDVIHIEFDVDGYV